MLEFFFKKNWFLTKVIVFKVFKMLKTQKHSEIVQIVGYTNTNCYEDVSSTTKFERTDLGFEPGLPH